MHHDRCSYPPPSKPPQARENGLAQGQTTGDINSLRTASQRAGRQRQAQSPRHRARAAAALGCSSGLICGPPGETLRERTAQGAGASSAPKCPTPDLTANIPLVRTSLEDLKCRQPFPGKPQGPHWLQGEAEGVSRASGCWRTRCPIGLIEARKDPLPLMLPLPTIMISL